MSNSLPSKHRSAAEVLACEYLLHPSGDAFVERQHDQVDLRAQNWWIRRVILEHTQLLVTLAPILVVEDESDHAAGPDQFEARIFRNGARPKPQHDIRTDLPGTVLFADRPRFGGQGFDCVARGRQELASDQQLDQPASLVAQQVDHAAVHGTAGAA
jgi:hypothetical protein